MYSNGVKTSVAHDYAFVVFSVSLVVSFLIAVISKFVFDDSFVVVFVALGGLVLSGFVSAVCYFAVRSFSQRH